MFELFGQTETCCPATLTKYGDMTAEHVGIPFDGVEVKLVDVPDMGYFAKNECGEICTRSSFNMDGYYKMPEMTAETLDEEGWIHTGDIGMWLPVSHLRQLIEYLYCVKLCINPITHYNLETNANFP